MKRVIVAVLLLLIIIGGCVLSIHAQHAVIEEFLQKTAVMESRFIADDINGALTAAEEFVTEYTHKTRYFSLFLPHVMLTEVERSVVSLPAILSHGEHKDFVAELRRCRLLLQKLHDLEIPTLQNIF